jgi:signal transduction histidine kinase
MMTIQAGAAKTVAESDPKAAIKAMAAVERAGRQALSEMRQLLSLLVPSTQGANLTPQPSPMDIPEMIAQLAQVGMDVKLDMPSELLETRDYLSPKMGLTVYRITQEAMTNILKHEGQDVGATINIKIEPDLLSLQIQDSGVGGRPVEFGHGISGMRERAKLLGGELIAGPGENGGFEVSAEIPIGKGDL